MLLAHLKIEINKRLKDLTTKYKDLTKEQKVFMGDTMEGRIYELKCIKKLISSSRRYKRR